MGRHVSENSPSDGIPEEALSLQFLPIAAAVADLSAVRKDWLTLRETGMDDFESFLSDYPDETRRFLDHATIEWFNEEAKRCLGLKDAPISGERIRRRIGVQGESLWRRLLANLAAGVDHVDATATVSTDAGKDLSFRVRAALPSGSDGDWSRVLLFFDDFRDGKRRSISHFDEWAGSKQLFRNLSLGFALQEMVWDEEGHPVNYRFLLVNPAFEKMTGLMRADIVGRMATEVQKDLDPMWIETYAEVARSGKPAIFETRFASMKRDFEIRAYRPGIGLCAVVVQDITDRLRDERALSEREGFLRAILETTGDGFFVADAHGIITDVNSAYCAVMGAGPDRIVGTPIYGQAADGSPEKTAIRLKRIKEQGQDRFETQHRRTDGSIVDVDITASWLPQGTGSFIAFVRDVTRRKAAERVMSDQKERLGLALAGTGAGIWDWDMKTGLMLLDENFGRIIGLGPAEIVGQNKARWAEFCHPEDLHRSAEILERHVAGQIPRYECELRMKRSDGLWIWVLNQGELVERDAEGRPSRMIGLLSDISVRKENEERLKTAIREKEALVGELYHRTKNSMQLINAMLELKKQEIDDLSVYAAFDDIQAKILAMALVQEKLYQADCLTSIDLGSYVTDLIDRLQGDMPVAGTCIDFSAEGESIEVSADIAIPCGLVLSELIGNSITHAFPRRSAGRISVAVRKGQDGAIDLEEWDDGVGLPSGYDPRVAGRMGLRTVIGIGEEQLHGIVSFGSRGEGFSCKVTFKDIYYPKRV